MATILLCFICSALYTGGNDEDAGVGVPPVPDHRRLALFGLFLFLLDQKKINVFLEWSVYSGFVIYWRLLCFHLRFQRVHFDQFVWYNGSTSESFKLPREIIKKTHSCLFRGFCVEMPLVTTGRLRCKRRFGSHTSLLLLIFGFGERSVPTAACRRTGALQARRPPGSLLFTPSQPP